MLVLTRAMLGQQEFCNKPSGVNLLCDVAAFFAQVHLSPLGWRNLQHEWRRDFSACPVRGTAADVADKSRAGIFIGILLAFCAGAVYVLKQCLSVSKLRKCPQHVV